MASRRLSKENHTIYHEVNVCRGRSGRL